MEKFDSMLSPVIDSTLGQRCSSIFGYQFSEIVRSLMSVYFCGGSCIEDVTTHLMYHLSLHPTFRTCSADTILRAIKELTQDNISYTSDTGKTYDFNTADTLNSLLLNCLFATSQLKEGEMEGEEADLGEVGFVGFNHTFLDFVKFSAADVASLPYSLVGDLRTVVPEQLPAFAQCCREARMMDFLCCHFYCCFSCLGFQIHAKVKIFIQNR